MSQAIAIARHRWTAKGRLEKALTFGVLALFGLQLTTGLATTIFVTLRDPLWRDALSQSTLAGLATTLGALALLAFHRVDGHRLSLMLGVAAGAMSMAALLALLLPALSATGFAPTTMLAGVAGVALMAILDRTLPHRHPPTLVGGGNEHMARTAALLTVAIALHNLPEGFAVAAAAGDGGGTALAIAVQNLPEGLIVASVLWSAGASRGAAIRAAVATGLMEPVGALLGIAWIGASVATAPLAMAAAGGTMLFVVVHELIPSAARGLAAPMVVISVAAGFVTMLLVASLF